MKLIDVTSKTTLFMVHNGKVMAIRFTKLVIEEPTLGITNKLSGTIIRADGSETRFTYHEFKGMKFYGSAEDALKNQNEVRFYTDPNDLYAILSRCGCVPTVMGVARYLYVWQYQKIGDNIGAKARVIEKIDVLQNKIDVDNVNHRIGETPKWYNTKEECIADNEGEIEVVNFNDKEMEEEEQADGDCVRIVFIEVIKNK